MWEFGVLGPIEVRGENGPFRFDDPRQREVLARLLAARGAVVPAQLLISDVFPGEPAGDALAALQSCVTALRRVLEPNTLASLPPGYALRAATVDAEEFERLVRTACAVPDFDRALALWRGSPYADLAARPWAAAEIARLTELRLRAREQRLGLLLGHGAATEAVTELRELTAAHPYRESLWCLLAIALHRAGRSADALFAVRLACDVISDELGVEPGHELRRLEAELGIDAPRIDESAMRMELTPTIRAPEPRDPLIGRERHLSALLRLAEPDAGPAVVGPVVIVGEPGIGKTRLLGAFGDALGRRGWSVAETSCTPGTAALHAWRQILSRDTPDRLPEAVRRLFADGATPMTTGTAAHPAPPYPADGSEPPPPGGVPGPWDGIGLWDGAGPWDGADTEPGRPCDDARHAMFAAVTEHVAGLAEERPLLLAIDDLQHADQTTLDLLAYVAAALPAARPAHTVVLAAASTSRAFGTTQIAPDGLDAAEIEAMALAIGLPVARETVKEIAKGTGGNPYFAREVLRCAAYAPDEAEAARAALEGGTAGVVRHGLARLPAPVRDTLAAAAVIGADLDPGLVAEVGGRSQEQVDEALDLAFVLGVLTRGPDLGLRFAHEIVRDVLRAGLTDTERARLHRCALNTLAARPGTCSAVAAQHAFAALESTTRHSRRFVTVVDSGARSAAVRWAVAAARESSARLASDDAVRWWSRAADAYRGPVRELTGLWLGQIAARLDAGDVEGARRTRADALDRIERDPSVRDDPLLKARLLTALDAPAVWTRLPYREVEPRLVNRLEQTLAALPYGDSPIRCRMYSGLARELHGVARPDRCESLAHEAAEMARRIGRPRLTASVLQDRLHSAAQSGDAVTAERLAHELIGLADAGRLLGYGLAARLAVVPLLAERYELAEADRVAAECEALLTRVTLPGAGRLHALWHSTRAMLAGRPVDEGGRARTGSALADRTLPTSGRPAGPAPTPSAGREGGAYAVGDVLADVVGSVNSRTHGWEVQPRGDLYRDTIGDTIGDVFGDLEGAHADLAAYHRDGRSDPALASIRRRILPQAPPLADALADHPEPPPASTRPTGWAWLSLTCLEAQSHVAAGDAEAATLTLTTLVPYADRLATGHGLLPAGPVGYHLGRLALLCRRDNEARVFLRDALDRCTRAGLPNWESRIRAALASI
ncbi:BTAD domain-containing putative transcriptional regulator [Spongiactinospora sp. 9N601]|uniref:BTAD domain-containing putative transcriptional regulator n=1 Tax=Spongiactinospora sp. 9N601 TaxID=3375149 RepID=UPI0037962276